MNKKNVFLKVGLFLFLFCVIFAEFQSVLTNPEENQGYADYQRIRGFYEEPDDSLDAVFIGASNVFTSWDAPIAYKKYGIRVFPFAYADQSIDSVKAIIASIREKQPNALFIICVNSALWDSNIEDVHRHTAYVGLLERIRLLYNLRSTESFPRFDMLELLFPIIRFHARWEEVTSEDFHHSLNGLKGVCLERNFLGRQMDVSATFHNTETRDEMQPFSVQAINELLDYIGDNEIPALFVNVPWAAKDVHKERLNTACDLIKNRGFQVLNLLEYLDEMELNPVTDYRDESHVNLHGSLKVTDFLANYLLDHYDFPEKSGGGGYESWDIAYDKYKEIITPYLTEEELAQLP